MRIAIAYPPLPSEKGVPLLSQNRQFQWFSRPTYIYPVVPALFIVACSLLVIGSLVEKPVESLWGLGLVALGLPAYAFWRRRARGE